MAAAPTIKAIIKGLERQSLQSPFIPMKGAGFLFLSREIRRPVSGGEPANAIKIPPHRRPFGGEHVSRSALKKGDGVVLGGCSSYRGLTIRRWGRSIRYRGACCHLRERAGRETAIGHQPKSKVRYCFCYGG